MIHETFGYFWRLRAPYNADVQKMRWERAPRDFLPRLPGMSKLTQPQLTPTELVMFQKNGSNSKPETVKSSVNKHIVI